MLKRLASCLLAICIAPTVLAADRDIPYEDMHGMFARLALMEGGQYVNADATLTSNDPAVPTDAIKLTIRSATGDLPVKIDATGRTEFPLSDELLEENPPVTTNVAEGKLSLSVSMRIEAPPAERFRYGVMVEMQDELAAKMRKQGMLARMFAPDFEGLAIQFPAGTAAHAVVESASGEERVDAGADGRIVLADRDDWREEDPWVRVSGMPERISLQPEE